MNILKKILKKQKDTSPTPEDIGYIIGNQNIVLPATHSLPRFQKNHRLYDRFLPILAKHLPDKKIIVDIGANVGDTLISMIQNTENNYFFCVDPSDEFFKYLLSNISLLDEQKKSKVKVFKNLIGTNEFSGKIIENGLGTASLNVSTDILSVDSKISLDELLYNQNEIILIKVDTDGYDFDVLLSGKNICINEKPILFWENEVKTERQKEGYKELYNFLSSNGYEHIFIFDNFGNIMLENTNFKELSDLTDYVYSMNNNQSTRTIYYNDVLAVTSNNLSLVNRAINEYKKFIKL